MLNYRKQQFSTQVVCFLSLFVYPLWFLYPVFFQDAQHIGPGVSDLTGAVSNAKILQSMPYPWSFQFLTNYPIGESFWRFENFTQLSQLIATWLLTRFLSPSHSIALLEVALMVLNGVILWRLAKILGLGKNIAVLPALLAQSLPWTQELLMSQTSFLASALVLWPTVILLENQRNLSRRDFLRVLSVLSFVFFTDAYLFFFTCLALVICILVLWPKEIFHSNFQNRVLVVAGLAVWTLSYVIFSRVENRDDPLGRPIQVPSGDAIHFWLGNPLYFLTPDIHHFIFPMEWSFAQGIEFKPSLINYLGVSVIAIAIVGIVHVTKSRNTISNRVVLAISAIFFLASIKTSFYLPFSDIKVESLSNLLKYFMPGVRVFSRTGIVVQYIMCIYAVIGLAYLFSLLKGRTRSITVHVIAICLTISIIIVDITPFSRRAIPNGVDLMQPQITELSRFPKPILFQIPFGSGRFWIERAHLQSEAYDLRSVNALYESSFSTAFSDGIRLSPKNLAERMSCLGVTHVLVTESPKSIPWDQSALAESVIAPYFLHINTVQVPGSTPDYDVRLALYRLMEEPLDQNQEKCLQEDFDLLTEGDSISNR